jgi:hypothetical protein
MRWRRAARLAGRSAFRTISAAALALAPAAALWPAPARAQDAGGQAELPGEGQPVEGAVALEYVLGKGAGGCPGEADFRERTQASFDYADPFVASGTAAPVKIRVAVAKAGPRYRGTVTILAEGRAARESAEEHENCDALVWVLANRMTLAIARKPKPACPACPRCEACPAPEPCPAPVPSKPEPPKEETCDAACVKKKVDELCQKYGHCPNMGPTLAIMGGGLLTAGWASVVGPGAFLGGEVKWEKFSIGVEARGTFPTQAQRYYKSPPTSDLFSFSGLIVPCGRYKWLLGCGLVEVGQWTFTVPNDPKGNASDLLLSLGLRGGVDVPLAAGFSIRGFADFAFHPLAPYVDVTDHTDPSQSIRTWQLPWISGFFGLAVAWSK